MSWAELLTRAQELLALAVVFSLGSVLLPEGSLRGTVRAVMGVVVLAAVVAPAVGLVEDADSWRQAQATWAGPGPGSPAGAAADDRPLVREGLHEAMGAEALRLAAGRAGAVARRALEGAGYEPLEVRVLPGEGATLQLDVRARRRALAGVAPDRLAEYVAALVGLDGPQAVRIQLEP